MKTTRWGFKLQRVYKCTICKEEPARDDPRNRSRSTTCHLKDGNGVGQTGGEKDEFRDDQQ